MGQPHPENSIINCQIGTGFGTTALPTNGNDGVDIFDAPFTTVGGPTAIYRDIISGIKASGW